MKTMRKNKFGSEVNSENMSLSNFYDPLTLIEAYNGERNMVLGLKEDEISEQILLRIDLSRIKVELERANHLKKIQKKIDLENETNLKNAEMM